MQVGFVGLGDQGLPMAHRILAAGFPLTVWARRQASVASFIGSAATVAPRLADLASCDVVGVCVYDGDGVREVVLGAGADTPGLAGVLRPGSVVLVHSTISPGEVRDLAHEAAEHGVVVVDAPVSGGAPAAEAGTLTVMLGGESAALDRVEPVVAAYAGAQVRLGGVGAGQQAKLLNNALVNAQMALVTDALEIGARLGLDAAALAEVLRTGSGRSFALEVILGGRPREVLAATRSRVTIGKDVRLATDEFGAGPPDALLSVARRWADALDGLHHGETSTRDVY